MSLDNDFLRHINSLDNNCSHRLTPTTLAAMTANIGERKSANMGDRKGNYGERYVNPGGRSNNNNHVTNHNNSQGRATTSTNNPQPVDANTPAHHDEYSLLLERRFMRTLYKVCRAIDANDFRLADQDRRNVNNLEWQQVALVVDRILLVLFTVGTVAITLSILLHAPHSRDFIISLVTSADAGDDVIDGASVTVLSTATDGGTDV